MTSFIIISKDKSKREAYLKDFYTKNKVDLLDVAITSFDNSVKQNMQSIGIEDVKQMQKKVFLKPLKSTNKVVVLEDAQLLTTEAQNALLKVLEEPPANTFIILTADTKEGLLPTIISRCFIVDLGENMINISEKEKKELEEFLEQLTKWGIGERLKKAETLAKDKAKAIEWIEKVIIVAREKMLSEENALYYAEQIKMFQTLHATLKTTNTNPRFAIENTFLKVVLQ